MTTPAGTTAAGSTQVRVPPPRLIGVVAGSGAAGALARHMIELLLPWRSTLPWATFLVNVLGCLLIGVATGILADARARAVVVPTWWRPMVVTGFLGGFTTFSTYILEVVTLSESGVGGQLNWAMAYLIGSVVAGVAAVWLGLRVAARVPWRAWSADVDIG